MRREILQGKMGIDQQPGQDVVEVWGDASREDAEALHLLGLLDLGFQLASFFFGLLAVGDVLRNA